MHFSHVKKTAKGKLAISPEFFWFLLRVVYQLNRPSLCFLCAFASFASLREIKHAAGFHAKTQRKQRRKEPVLVVVVIAIREK